MDDLPKADPSDHKNEDLNKKSRLLFEGMGWTVATTQWFNAYTNRSYDLFGFADLMLFIPPSPDTVLIQVTSKHNRLERLKKILSNRKAYDWARSKHHLIWLSLWERNTRRQWEHTIEQVFEKDFEEACLIDCYRDVEFPPAPIEQLKVVATASITPQKQKRTDGAPPIRRSTTANNGES